MSSKHFIKTILAYSAPYELEGKKDSPEAQCQGCSKSFKRIKSFVRPPFEWNRGASRIGHGSKFWESTDKGLILFCSGKNLRKTFSDFN